jgi:hypothetical protein
VWGVAGGGIEFAEEVVSAEVYFAGEVVESDPTGEVGVHVVEDPGDAVAVEPVGGRQAVDDVAG